MNVFCDFHHADLWWSTYLILEKDLGHQLFRPRGMEWYDNGFIFPDNKDVARQFLEHSMYEFYFAMKHFEKAKSRLEKENDDTLWAGMDTINGCPFYPLFRTLTLEEFMKEEIDVIMPTVAAHQEPFLRLRDTFKPNAKLLREAGNPGELHSLHPDFDNLLTSDTESFKYGKAKNKLIYHQKFDVNIFNYLPPNENKVKIGCFMPTFRVESGAFEFLKEHLDLLPEIEFIDYGVNSAGGYLNTKSDLANAMRECTFIWQIKPRGDGFGHIIHNAFAMGRPPIVIKSHYAGRLAESLMSDETCIFISDNPIENVAKIKAAIPRISEMSKKSHEAFSKLVDYSYEKREIKSFLERL